MVLYALLILVVLAIIAQALINQHLLSGHRTNRDTLAEVKKGAARGLASADCAGCHREVARWRATPRGPLCDNCHPQGKA